MSESGYSGSINDKQDHYFSLRFIREITLPGLLLGGGVNPVWREHCLP
jgi:hypothetical protein